MLLVMINSLHLPSLIEKVAFSTPDILWPWTGNLGLHIRITEEAANWNGQTLNYSL